MHTLLIAHLARADAAARTAAGCDAARRRAATAPATAQTCATTGPARFTARPRHA